MTATVEVPGMIAWLERIQACSRGVVWARQCGSILEAGEACPDPEWLLWTVRESGFSDAVAGMRFSTACVKRVRRLLRDPRQELALSLLDGVATGSGGERERAEAAQLAAAAQKEAAWSPHWSVGLAAAGAALWRAATGDPWESAPEVYKQCLRAAAWDAQGDVEIEKRALAAELKAALRPHARDIVQAVQTRAAAVSPAARSCGCG